MFKLSLHTHTYYSREVKSWREPYEFYHFRKGNPREVIMAVYRNGLDGIVITEQNNYGASHFVTKLGNELKRDGKIRNPRFLILAGEEVSTRDGGHYVVIGHEENLGPYKYSDELIDKVKQSGAVIFPAHPLLNQISIAKEGTPLSIDERMLRKQLDRLDAVERYNGSVISLARALPSIRRKFLIQQQKLSEINKPMVAGDDNHSAQAVGHIYTYVEKADNLDELIHSIKHGRVITTFQEYKPRDGISATLDWFNVAVTNHPMAHAKFFLRSLLL